MFMEEYVVFILQLQNMEVNWLMVDLMKVL